MPGYPWLEGAPIDGEGVQKRMRVLRVLGLPYTDEEIDKAPQVLVGKTEMDGMIAYLQGLGIHVKVRR